MRVGTLTNGLNTLIKETGQLSSLFPPGEDAVRSMHIRRRLSSEPIHTGTLISDFQPLALGKIKFCWY